MTGMMETCPLCEKNDGILSTLMMESCPLVDDGISIPRPSFLSNLKDDR